jgi:hypothetical protein
MWGTFPLSCGCSLENSDTQGSQRGLIRCKHGRLIFVPSQEGVQLQSWGIEEMRTHLL